MMPTIDISDLVARATVVSPESAVEVSVYIDPIRPSVEAIFHNRYYVRALRSNDPWEPIDNSSELYKLCDIWRKSFANSVTLQNFLNMNGLRADK